MPHTRGGDYPILISTRPTGRPRSRRRTLIVSIDATSWGRNHPPGDATAGTDLVVSAGAGLARWWGAGMLLASLGIHEPSASRALAPVRWASNGARRRASRRARLVLARAPDGCWPCGGILLAVGTSFALRGVLTARRVDGVSWASSRCCSWTWRRGPRSRPRGPWASPPPSRCGTSDTAAGLAWLTAPTGIPSAIDPRKSRHGR